VFLTNSGQVVVANTSDVTYLNPGETKNDLNNALGYLIPVPGEQYYDCIVELRYMDESTMMFVTLDYAYGAFGVL